MCFANGPMLPEVDDATLQQTSEWWDMLPDMAAGAPGAPPAQQVYPGSSAGSAPHVDTPVEDAGFADFSDLFNDDDMDTKPIAEVLPAVKTEPRAARSSETSVPLQMQAAAPLLPAQMLLQSQLLMNPVLGMGLPMFNPALYQATSGAEACLPSAGQATCGAAGAAGTHAVKHKNLEDHALAVERTKEKRRQSAQRSRQRKSAYIKSLEAENQTLKCELEKLKQVIREHLPQAAAALD